MPVPPKNMFDNGMSRSRISKQGLLTQIVIDGAGAMIIETAEFASVEKWAKTKNSTGSLTTDRNRFFERVTTVISRPGSLVTTRGSEKQLISLARLMKGAGLDVNEWNLAPEIRNPKTDEELRKEKDEKVREAAHYEAIKEEEARAAAKPGDMDDPYAGMKR
jgi:hypothetical protein